MTIGFSTHWPKKMPPDYAGKPTFFVEKITKCASKMFGKELDEYIKPNIEKLKYPSKDIFIDTVIDSHPKKHTFREDPSDRWKVGMKIHPVINNRTKNRFQFTPELEVKSIQKVKIEYAGDAIVVTIDEKQFFYWYHWGYNPKLDDITSNDGFESVHQFFSWFSEDWSGKIIHWTDLKY